MAEGSGPVIVTADRHAEVASVLTEAFRDYPVMQFVLGHEGDYDRRLETLVHFFTTARVLRDEIMLAVEDDAGPVAAALVSYPDRPSPPALAEVRERTWESLGSAARERYESFGHAAGAFDPDRPHIHLNMIGVRDRGRGSGLARQLLDHVHGLSADDPSSTGVSLTTEDPANVSLYRHFGYEIIGHERLGPGLETWGFFRPDAG